MVTRTRKMLWLALLGAPSMTACTGRSLDVGGYAITGEPQDADVGAIVDAVDSSAAADTSDTADTSEAAPVTSANPSCLGGGVGVGASCGVAGDDCCASRTVTGGTFYRGGCVDGACYESKTAPATVSDFQLDVYDVTVGRFRKFVAATAPSSGPRWLPAPGSGKHAHLDGGAGLVDTTASALAHEAGWDAAWSALLPADPATWDAHLAQCSDATWSPSGADAGGAADDRRPVNCVDWYAAYAFCIWDGGFLPSDAELDYATAGGSEQRYYAWGAKYPAADTTLAVYDCYLGGTDGGTGSCGPGASSIATVGSAPLGAGKWGQLDLLGNVQQWVLDGTSTLEPSSVYPYATASIDGAALSTAPLRVVRGLAYFNDQPSSFDRSSLPPDTRLASTGVRCARPVVAHAGLDAGVGDAAAAPDVTSDSSSDSMTDAADAADPDAGITPFQSCRGGPGAGTTCGASGAADCCASPPVAGGTYYRDFDGVPGGGAESKAWPATVSPFRLDSYEVTVGRFRSFVEATTPATGTGWTPTAGAGKHTHVHGGKGLEDVDAIALGATGDRAYESGWKSAWNVNLAATRAEWDARLRCQDLPGFPATWTPTPGANEERAIACVRNVEAYAFCIWDGGFLPTEAEWNFAAAGGSEQRVYPWSSPPSSTSIDASRFGAFRSRVGAWSPGGDGRFGQSDLAGGVMEWTLDSWGDGLLTPCSDCANLRARTVWALRGGSYLSSPTGLTTSTRRGVGLDRSYEVGFRCARAP
jgi:formylglycine-generating enzyme required for sulfatase activity